MKISKQNFILLPASIDLRYHHIRLARGAPAPGGWCLAGCVVIGCLRGCGRRRKEIIPLDVYTASRGEVLSIYNIYPYRSMKSAPCELLYLLCT